MALVYCTTLSSLPLPVYSFKLDTLRLRMLALIKVEEIVLASQSHSFHIPSEIMVYRSCLHSPLRIPSSHKALFMALKMTMAIHFIAHLNLMFKTGAVIWEIKLALSLTNTSTNHWLSI